ncbi:CHAT domain-containing protein [Nitrosomonas sp.]|uniref:CHAT domain-containing protein n=1 Tax=Nitrosomonas sp. TaxID=42353 RepID=UPI002731522D|nr:CHAT domain-containing protein [Nitrosomonas sp.]MDP2225070.1 TIR domain-containing protein [Nitrosomonas sp.]
MTKLFISHSSQDDAFVRELREALADYGQAGWIDSRELRGGDLLWPEIQKAIDDASAYAVVVSPNGLQSDWVGDELAYALDVQKQRGKDEYPVIPLSLDGTKLGVLKQLFATEPLYISVSSEAGGIEAAMDAVLVALRRRNSADVSSTPQPKAEPLEDLVLELSDLKFDEQEGKRRASARARLIYEPATPGQREVVSEKQWRFVAPIDPIEVDELRWYLEKYSVWPSHYFRDRARKVEENLVKWGQLLHKEAMPAVPIENVMLAWARINDRAGRRFSIHVDTVLESGAPEVEVVAAREAATLLLGLPWELLHDGDGYLFQGAKPTRVRRRLPNTKVLDVPVVAPPIRILLVTARPEDEACGYIDHRASALPLVDAMESLPGLVKLQVLNPPTLPSLRAELDRARGENKPYHVVHFDGHGVYDRSVGLGGLCFELPEDSNKLEQRRHATVFTSELGPLLRDHRIPLVFLEACQTAQAEKASESVASELLKVGVASVVAMSHSVLVETAKRFVAEFYQALAAGKRVGDAMLAGQRQLKDDTFRGRIFGAGELRLEDWFVPVLFQEKDDPQLFKTAPAKQTLADFQSRLQVWLGELPPKPQTGFVGRSRELLALQRLLQNERYAVVRGQGGEGKTALVAEFARWMVRSQQIRRAAFVSVETHSHAAAVLDALGHQLVGQDYSVATFEDLDQAMLPVERALREQFTLLIVDNMESILLPPFMQQETPQALSDDARETLQAILALCQRLLQAGDTRLLFTSREALLAPFDAERNRRELHRLDRDDAVKLVERVLNATGNEAGTANDAAREEIEQLVDTVHGHVRTLSLLAPVLRSRGVTATRESLAELMLQMEKDFPGNRDKSLYASVELSLRRLSENNRNKVQVFGIFHGGFHFQVLRNMMQWKDADASSLIKELIATGLATEKCYGYFALNPALCFYLREKMDTSERESLVTRWTEAMKSFVEFLDRQRANNAEGVTTLTLLELQNLFVLLIRINQTESASATINLVSNLHNLMQMLGKRRLVEQLARIRDDAEKELSDSWDSAHFQVARTKIMDLMVRGKLGDALLDSQNLLQQARAVGENNYPHSDCDLALACSIHAQMLIRANRLDQALPLIEEALRRFRIIVQACANNDAKAMISVCLTELGNYFSKKEQYNESAKVYEESIRHSEQHKYTRETAVAKGALGFVYLLQDRLKDALETYEDARKLFAESLNEPNSVAVCWFHIGRVYEAMAVPEEAEKAYRESLRIDMQSDNIDGQACALGQLGLLYDNAFNLTEESVRLLQQALDLYIGNRDIANEGQCRFNLAIRLQKLRRCDEARREIGRAIECNEKFGHANRPWIAWATLASIEIDAGNSVAATVAKQKAIACYLVYRRDGGENHNPVGEISVNLTKYLLAGNNTSGSVLSYQLSEGQDPNSDGFQTYIQALQAIVDGSRDPGLADAPNLHYMMAAEILLMIGILEKSS